MKSLRQGIMEYLEYRWRLGFKLGFVNHLLISFASFMDQNGAKHITNELAVAFATMNPEIKTATWAYRLGIIRRFAIYWSTVDCRTEVPPKNLLPNSYSRRHPYIYSDTEIIKLLTCKESDYPSDRLDQYTYFVLFGLLAVTGMRFSEALTLDRKAVDIAGRIITIHQSKFRKSRYIPIHKSTEAVLKDYNNYRDHCFPSSTSSRFFIDSNGSDLPERRVRYVFDKRLKKIGIEKPWKHCKPRILDLRHTFAIKTLLKWYHQGVVTIDCYIPLLSTYLGHVKPTNTYWYLTATPQLLKLVLSRCEKQKRRIVS